jgi:hypothetical protein
MGQHETYGTDASVGPSGSLSRPNADTPDKPLRLFAAHESVEGEVLSPITFPPPPIPICVHLRFVLS